MNTAQKTSQFILKVSSFLLFVIFIFPALALTPQESSLKVYEGYRFSDKSVVKSDDKSADISFYVNRGRAGSNSFALGALGARKIKEFGKEKPDVSKITPADCAKWEHSVNAPSAGYYVVQSADEKEMYLLKVISFQNQGKASSFWKLNFTYEKWQNH